MLRCTLAGMIPLMASNRYGVLADVFYEFRRGDFDHVMKSGSYYLLRELPGHIAARMLLPRAEAILAAQGKDGLWPGADPLRRTYDVVSAFLRAGARCKLPEQRIDSLLGALQTKNGLYPLLIKKTLGRAAAQDLQGMEDAARQIRKSQLADGSFSGTVFATVCQAEKILQLSADGNDPAVKKGVDYLFGQLRKRRDAAGNPYDCGRYVFSTPSGAEEYRSACRHRPEMRPRMASFDRLGILQNAWCLRLLIRLGYETDARVQASLDNILHIIQTYQSLCWEEIRKKAGAEAGRLLN